MRRQEKARLQDFKLLGRLSETEIKVLPEKTVDFSVLQEKIARIKNSRVRSFLAEYFRRRLAKTASRIKRGL